MTLHPNRPKMKEDLTRWNRASLSKFEYVDGDAANWLEELRIAMLGLYLRGAEKPEERTPEHWRDIFLKPKDEWPDVAVAAQRVAWKRLAPGVPPQPETRGRRNERLISQYQENTGDYGWEINRAFARASHVLLGYLDAYANEGYLPTATQWDNLRRLAAMVNYQPTPQASATTIVAILLKENIGKAEIQRGFAMKHTPAEGGAPLVFETLETELTHEALNKVRSVGWNKNKTPIEFGNAAQPRTIAWHLPKKDSLSPGDLVVLSTIEGGQAHSIEEITHNLDSEVAQIGFVTRPTDEFLHGSSQLYSSPLEVRFGLQQSQAGRAVVEIDNGGGFMAGDLIDIIANGRARTVEILAIVGGDLILNADLSRDTQVVLRPMLSFALDERNRAFTGKDISKMQFLGINGPFAVSANVQPASDADEKMRRTLSNIFIPDTPKTPRGYASDHSAATIGGRIKTRKPTVLPGKSSAPANTVSFEGKPPKALTENDWFVARNSRMDVLKALRVVGLRTSSGEYHILFNEAPLGEHQDNEFYGPFIKPLRAVGFDRNPEPVMSGGKAVLAQIPEAVYPLLKPGRKVIVSRENNGVHEDRLATLTAIAPAINGTGVQVFLDPPDTAQGWSSGETVFYLNTAQISHGETKGTKILGSGDGEHTLQVFEFLVANVSHIPSSTTSSGVSPDIDISVNGERWDYRDYVDSTAEGTRAWSTTLTDQGTLKIHFRRRLVTGQDNVIVVRHRVGAGHAGSGIASFSLVQPMKKDRFVETIYQPFETSGGADREPVEKLRHSAPSHLSANGRAVSLKDFERLAMRHAAILHAHAEQLPTPTANLKVELTVVLVGGAPLTESLKEVLRPAILNKCIPGIRLSFREFVSLPLHVGVIVRSDLAVNNKIDIKAAAEVALADAFSLEIRTFGQIAYISELLATLETVPGIGNAQVTRFDLGNAYDLLEPKPANADKPWPLNVATRDGRIVAIYPLARQVIHIPATGNGVISVIVEDL